MKYLRLWLAFYAKPSRFASALLSAPRPTWGLLACLHRSLMDSLLLYLPLSVMGRLPPEPSYLPFIRDEVYYAALVGMTPIVFLAQWLLSAASTHLVLRLSGRQSDIDHILNIGGFAGLGVGTVLLVWDWIWVFVGGMTQYTLGISHLLFDLWGVGVSAHALRALLGIPLWLGAVLTLLGVALGFPLAVAIMRSPL